MQSFITQPLRSSDLLSWPYPHQTYDERTLFPATSEKQMVNDTGRYKEKTVVHTDLQNTEKLVNNVFGRGINIRLQQMIQQAAIQI